MGRGVEGHVFVLTGIRHADANSEFSQEFVLSINKCRDAYKFPKFLFAQALEHISESSQQGSF